LSSPPCLARAFRKTKSQGDRIKPLIDIRTRYEFADADGTDVSRAWIDDHFTAIAKLAYFDSDGDNYRAVRSYLMRSSGVCRFLFMGVDGAHAPGLS
jgi:hypothetical protein